MPRHAEAERVRGLASALHILDLSLGANSLLETPLSRAAQWPPKRSPAVAKAASPDPSLSVLSCGLSALQIPPPPPHASFGNFFPEERAGYVSVPSSPSPLLFLLGLNFFPWHFTGSQSKRPDLQRGENQAAPPLLLPAQNWNLKRVRGEKAKQEELGFLSHLRTDRFPSRTSQRGRLHLCSELLEYHWPRG